jgi:hypothetical protein
MICPGCLHPVTAAPKANATIAKDCRICGTTFQITAGMPKLSEDKLQQVRYQQERETYDGAGNRVPLPAAGKGCCALGVNHV